MTNCATFTLHSFWCSSLWSELQNCSPLIWNQPLLGNHMASQHNKMVHLDEAVFWVDSPHRISFRQGWRPSYESESVFVFSIWMHRVLRGVFLHHGKVNKWLSISPRISPVLVLVACSLAVVTVVLLDLYTLAESYSEGATLSQFIILTKKGKTLVKTVDRKGFFIIIFF